MILGHISQGIPFRTLQKRKQNLIGYKGFMPVLAGNFRLEQIVPATFGVLHFVLYLAGL